MQSTSAPLTNAWIEHHTHTIPQGTVSTAPSPATCCRSHQHRRLTATSSRRRPLQSDAPGAVLWTRGSSRYAAPPACGPWHPLLAAHAPTLAGLPRPGVWCSSGGGMHEAPRTNTDGCACGTRHEHPAPRLTLLSSRRHRSRSCCAALAAPRSSSESVTWGLGVAGTTDSTRSESVVLSSTASTRSASAPNNRCIVHAQPHANDLAL